MLEGARELCDRICSNSPMAVQGAKRVLRSSMRLPLSPSFVLCLEISALFRFAEEHSVDDTLEHVAMWNSSFLESEDLMEAVKAFMTKQKPVFKNFL